MRIAHVTATFPPYQAGTGNVCYHNASQLALRGHDVHVFTAALPGAPARETLDGVQVHRLRPIFQIGNAPILPQLLWRLREFDVIHLHYPFIFGAEFSRLAAAITRTPLVITSHNDLIGDGLRAPLFAAYQRCSAYFTVRHAALLCAVTMDHHRHSQLQRFLRKDKPPVVEVPNGVNVEVFQVNAVRGKSFKRTLTSRAAKVILFVGALDRAHHYRRVDLLLQALKILDDRSLVLLLVGDGDKREQYESLAHELGVHNQLRFLGQVENSQLPSIYAEADVVVLPSDVQESFGIVLIEAMACAIPVLASDLPGVRTVVSHGRDGFLVKPGSVSDLVEKLTAIFAMSAAERTEMGQAGRNKVQEKYTWSRIGQQLEDLYSRILNAPVPVRSCEKVELSS